VSRADRGIAAAAALALLAACAPPPAVTPRAPPVPLATTPHHEEPGLAGVVHVVRRGETLYRIARAYGIDVADLMETNGIEDPRSVATGAELFVPGASRVVEIEGATATATANPNPNPNPSPSPSPTAPPNPNPTPLDEAGHPEPLDEARDRLRGAASAATRSRGAPTRAPPSSPSRARAPSLSWPLKGVLYGRYGVRGGERHDGIDIAAPEGAPVLAAADGAVLFAGEQPGYGALVILEHEGGLVTLYAHNSRVLVKEGARVRRGEAIARVGQTGRTTGPHLHFEVRQGTRPRNPLLFLP
jgi:murein DD-endopeptidase MepM/ murein hydrolase activator NlpD